MEDRKPAFGGGLRVFTHMQKAGAGPAFCCIFPSAGTEAIDSKDLSKYCARSDRLDALRQARNFSRRSILLEHATGHATHQFGLRLFKRGIRGVLVSTFNRGFNFLDVSPNAAGAL